MFEPNPSGWQVASADAPHPDPHDPFSNETEFHEYASDYGEVLPQIRLPGFSLPLMPLPQERRRIRFYMNLTGGFLAGHFLLMNLLFFILMEVYIFAQTAVDTAMNGTLPDNYIDLVSDYLTNSSSYLALTILVIGGSNLFFSLLGCRITKIPLSTLFQTRDLTAARVFAYVCICLCIQTVTGYAAYGLETLFEGVDITLYEADFSTTQDVKAVILSFVYSVIVAPVTEELFMRGFIQKNLSRVSQRFGIVTTAFLFGIWHENVAQFILAFVGGCFFGYIAAKHNSLVPSIIVHMCVNFAAEAFTFCETYSFDTAYELLNWFYTGLVLIGAVVLLVMLIRERMPRSTPAQQERGLRMLLTSPLMLLGIIIHVGAAVVYIVEATQGEL
ncbi:MAG: CPBP family intramembrane metalloprotease [Oscillospiraceae bacterium]|nr:CPBP family intramembrane metalloprotease [Oscillospiraceae bacterium]